MADFMISQILLGSVEDSDEDSSADEAQPAVIHTRLSLVPSVFPQNLSQSKWETLLENKMIAGA